MIGTWIKHESWIQRREACKIWYNRHWKTTFERRSLITWYTRRRQLSLFANCQVKHSTWLPSEWSISVESIYRIEDKIATKLQVHESRKKRWHKIHAFPELENMNTAYLKIISLRTESEERHISSINHRNGLHTRTDSCEMQFPGLKTTLTQWAQSEHRKRQIEIRWSAFILITFEIHSSSLSLTSRCPRLYIARMIEAIQLAHFKNCSKIFENLCA